MGFGIGSGSKSSSALDITSATGQSLANSGQLAAGGGFSFRGQNSKLIFGNNLQGARVEGDLVVESGAEEVKQLSELFAQTQSDSQNNFTQALGDLSQKVFSQLEKLTADKANEDADTQSTKKKWMIYGGLGVVLLVAFLWPKKRKS